MIYEVMREEYAQACQYDGKNSKEIMKLLGNGNLVYFIDEIHDFFHFGVQGETRYINTTDWLVYENANNWNIITDYDFNHKYRILIN